MWILKFDLYDNSFLYKNILINNISIKYMCNLSFSWKIYIFFLSYIRDLKLVLIFFVKKIYTNKLIYNPQIWYLQ